MAGKPWGDLIAPIPTHSSVATLNGARGLVYQRSYEWRAYPEEAPIVQYREDPSDPESAIVDEPARWWSPRSVGFRAKLLVNPTGGECRVELQKYVGSNFPGKDGQFTVTDQEYLEGIADRVVAWEFTVIDDDGTQHDIPAPGAPDGGWERFYDLPNDCLVWLREEIRGAHLPKAKTRNSKRAGPTDSAAPKKPTAETATTDPDPAHLAS